MKKFIYVTLIFLTLLSPVSPLSAQEKTETIKVEVSGMVCDFCAQSIFKVFHKETGLTEDQIDINLDTQLITITPGADLDITDKQISDFIYYAGYDLKNITRE